jgi:hypothetical protein
MSDESLAARLVEIQKSMDALAPHNGTGPGAAKISLLWNERDAVKHEIELRKAGL